MCSVMKMKLGQMDCDMLQSVAYLCACLLRSSFSDGAGLLSRFGPGLFFPEGIAGAMMGVESPSPWLVATME